MKMYKDLSYFGIQKWLLTKNQGSGISKINGSGEDLYSYTDRMDYKNLGTQSCGDFLLALPMSDDK